MTFGLRVIVRRPVEFDDEFRRGATKNRRCTDRADVHDEISRDRCDGRAVAAKATAQLRSYRDEVAAPTRVARRRNA